MKLKRKAYVLLGNDYCAIHYDTCNYLYFIIAFIGRIYFHIMKEVNKYVYYGNFNSLNKVGTFYHSGNYIVFGALRKSAKKTKYYFYITTAFIFLLLPNWYFDNDRYWQAGKH